MANKTTESRWTLKDLFTPKVKQAIATVKDFSASLVMADKEGKKFATGEASSAAAILKQKAALKESKVALSGLMGGLTTMLPLLGIGVAAGFVSATKSIADFQQQMAYVGTLLSGTTTQVNQQLGSMSGQIEALARSSGKSLNDLAGGLYQTLSAGVDAAHAMTVLGAATKAAIAGQTDTSTAIKVVTASLHAYGMNMDQAGKVTDIMLKNVNVGNAEFPELAQSLGLVLPSAASLNVSFTDLNASIAALTLVGLKTPSAIAGLNEAFMNILKPQQSAIKEAKALGIQFNAQALQAKGLVPFLEEIKAKTHGNTQEMAQLFGSIQGLNAMLALTSNNGMKQLVSAQKQMQNSAGTTAQAYKTMTNTIATQWNRLKQILITRGMSGATKSGVLVFVKNVLNAAIKTVNFVTNHWKTIGPIIYGIAGAFAAYTLAVTGAKLATLAFNAVTNMGILGVANILTTVLIAAILEVSNHWKQIKQVAIEVWADIKYADEVANNAIVKGAQWMVNQVIGLANDYLRVYKFAFDAVEYAGSSIWNGILNAAQSGINKLLKLMAPVSGILKKVGINIPTSVNFSGAMRQATAPKWDTSFGIPKINLSGQLMNTYKPSEIANQRNQTHLENVQLMKDHTKALRENTQTLKEHSVSTKANTASTDANTSATKSNTKSKPSSNGSKGSRMTAEEIADTLMPRLERHLYGNA